MAEDPMPVFVFGCISCGKTVEGNESACPRCGASFENVKFECPFCGELVSPTQRKCTACGTEFSAFAQEVSDTAMVELDGSEVGPIEDHDTREESDPEHVEYECPACGKPVLETDTTCPHCGAQFQ